MIRGMLEFNYSLVVISSLFMYTYVLVIFSLANRIACVYPIISLYVFSLQPWRPLPNKGSHPGLLFYPWSCSIFLSCCATNHEVSAIFETPRAYRETAAARFTRSADFLYLACDFENLLQSHALG